MTTLLNVGDWAWSQAHQQYVKVIESSCLWDQCFYRVWLHQQDRVVKVPLGDLSKASMDKSPSPHFFSYIGIAAKIANAQKEDILLASVESNVIPLPHQLKALDKAMSRKQVRYLFADEVGLGKTIEAGLVMRELKLRGMAKRILVCAPKGLVSQWVNEMSTHFGESFHLLILGENKPVDENDNVWLRHDLVVCPVDSIKPIESRKGWSVKQVHEYNKHRFDDLLSAGWDLIVIDEAHRLGGSTELVARYKLGQGLAEASPYLLLLSATPHQGKSDAFHRLMALLDKEAFPDVSSVTKERVQPYVVRTEKRISIDGTGKPLFKPRKTELIPVDWKSKHALQRHLYEEVTEYVKEGYNQAKAQKQNAIGFLMILMQRLVSSSSAAIAMTLSRRRALNFVLEDSVEHRVRDVLESKLKVILDEFGVDKASDVLDSAEVNHLFDELFMESISNPKTMDQELAKALKVIQAGARDKRSQDGLFSDGKSLNPSDYQKVIDHPLPYWVEQMVNQFLSFKSSQGVDASFTRAENGSICVKWPDGANWENITFIGKEAQKTPELKHITLENPKVRELSTNLPMWSEIQNIPLVRVPSLPSSVTGYWSLWSVRFSGQDERQLQYLPIYINTAGQYFATASNRVWDAICSDTLESDLSSNPEPEKAYQLLRKSAEVQGKILFDSMLAEYLKELELSVEKGEYSFKARRNAIERVGLPEVKSYRIRQLDIEYSQWKVDIDVKREIYPELNLHLVFEIKG